MKSFKDYILLCLLLFLTYSLGAEDYIARHLEIMEMKEAKAPQILAEQVLFTFRSEKPVFSVGIRFEHEEYNQLHVFEYNRHSIYFFYFPVPYGVKNLKYRLLVDGIWMEDPLNPSVLYDDWGVGFSVVDLGRERQEKWINPQISSSRVTFRFFSLPGKVIYIAGDFNGWDPYIHRLYPAGSGIYEIVLNLTPGRHYYYFLVDGVRLVDPENPNRTQDGEKNLFSTFVVSY